MQPATETTPRGQASRLAGIRADFPALDQIVNGHPLVYLDSAASALTPRPVIDAMLGIYQRDRANVHRGVHSLSQRATHSYERARETLRAFIGARSLEEVVFVRGTTEAMNLVAQSWARPRLAPGDEILVTGIEHHSNVVPWQLVCEATGATLVAVPMSEDGDVALAEIERRISKRTRLVSVAHVSNALGTVLPIREIARLAHAAGAVVAVDGAQAAPHIPIDVETLECDFYALSGHKLYGPTGIGILWGKRDHLAAMPPYQGGGDMIRTVAFEGSTWNDLPYKFEAGTPHIAGAVGLGAAADYVANIGFAALEAHERDLMTYGTDALREVPGLRLVGTAPHKVAILGFVLDCAHPHDIGTILDAEGVAIRTGHHCAQPIMDRLGIAGTARASLGMYNTREDIDALVRGLHAVRRVFA